jgi:CopG family nickel-responsive transcriptional regulator
MPIVSLSFPEQMLKDIDEIQKAAGFTGRSELVRAAVRLMQEDFRDKDALSGEISALIVVTHDREKEESVTRLKHQFEDIIKTHVHSKMSISTCVELFLVQGVAKKVVDMSRAFRAQDDMKSTKFIHI